MRIEYQFRFVESEIPSPEQIHRRLCEHTGLDNFRFNISQPREDYPGEVIYWVTITHEKLEGQHTGYLVEPGILGWSPDNYPEDFTYLEWAFIAVVQGLEGRLRDEKLFDIPDWAMKKWNEQPTEQPARKRRRIFG